MGKIMTVSHTEIHPMWTQRDWLGALAVRCSFGRMHYTVEPGLYAINSPSPTDPVFVSANYKLSFDHLRRALEGIAGWILVLDTKGINVWCAAGKGTFGTDELVERIATVNLAEVVSHRQLVVPQLGAPGVVAHEVLKQSGFRVIYGPVRANDIPRFLEAKQKADEDMRRVRFPLMDRLAVIPVEIVGSLRKAGLLTVIFALSAARRNGGWSWQHLQREGLFAGMLALIGYVSVSALVPALLPWLPGRAFSIKGVGTGLLAWLPLWAWGPYSKAGDLIAWLLLFMAMGAFMGLNYTGASTYTSLSGVKKETRLAVPVIVAGLLVSAIIWLYSCSNI